MTARDRIKLFGITCELKENGKIKHFHHGHEYVDLGLPSGTLWATCNVGASKETDFGNYYQYGKGIKQYATTSGDSRYRGLENTLDLSVDTARQVMRGDWHMPTSEQLRELRDDTICEWTTINGLKGRKFTSKVNGNYIFIPAAGDYADGRLHNVGNCGYLWSSSSYDRGYAYFLRFNDCSVNVFDVPYGLGFSVRGVLG